MTADALLHLADVEEIRIGFRRPDGSSGSTPIWVVQVGDDIYVRSVRGPRLSTTDIVQDLGHADRIGPAASTLPVWQPHHRIWSATGKEVSA